jgi:hypothetical protein
MTVHFGKIDVYFSNILSPKIYAGKRIINLKGTFGKAILWFLPDGSSLPDNRKRTEKNVFDVYYHTADWGAIIDLLRNETPVYFNYHETSNAAQIYTGDEPVGEEET